MQSLAFSVAYRLQNSLFAARKCEFTNIKPGKPRQMSFRACLAANNPPCFLAKLPGRRFILQHFLTKRLGCG
jgi:hypothetical protein